MIQHFDKVYLHEHQPPEDQRIAFAGSLKRVDEGYRGLLFWILAGIAFGWFSGRWLLAALLIFGLIALWAGDLVLDVMTVNGRPWITTAGVIGYRYCLNPSNRVNLTVYPGTAS